MTRITRENAEDRMRAVLAYTFRGIHHAPEIKSLPAFGTEPGWEVNCSHILATYDFDLLTRLVMAAHKYCVRVSLEQSGPRMVKIIMWPRYTQVGETVLRHPGVEELAKKLVKMGEEG
ncbi:MAG TPA: hypothetical protein ENH11_00475 [Candidatus Acetothermia bacterium]|nr:hypothetical protein [Candidatus Acetothermia bacterium]